MTTATLGFAIDSRPASSAAVDLEKLTSAAMKTEQSVESLEASAKGLGTALGQASQNAKTVGPAVEQVGRAIQQQDQHLQAFRMEMDRLTAKFQPMAQAAKGYEAAVSEINRAHQLGVINAQQMQRALDSERMAYERLKTAASGAGQAMQAANQNNMRAGAGFNTSSLAAQGFDVATTAAFMPWQTVALQQGPQVAQVFNDIRASGQAIGPAVAGAFAQILNPISLVTIGVIGGAAALIQYFTAAEEGSGKTSKLFEEQNEIIRRAADLWGEATPGLRAYVDELDRADKLTSGREAGEILAGRELDGLSDNLDKIKREAFDAFAALRGDPNNAVIIRDLRTAWGDLRDRLNDGSASMADLNNVQRELTNALATNGVPEVQKFKDAFDQVTEAIYRGVQAAQQARTAYIAAIAGGTNVQDIVSGSTFTDGGRTYRQSDFMPANPGVPTARPKIELEGLPGAGSEAPTIINSDGRLVNVPVPGQRPNYFEREAEAPAFSSSRANRNTYWERSVLQEELRRNEMSGAVKGFVTDFGQALQSSGGDIGEALAKSLQNALMNAMNAAWDRLATQVSGALVNALMGPPSAGLMNKQIGFTGANTTLGAVLGAGGVANDNVAGGFNGLAPVGAVSRMPLADISSYAKAIQSIESSGNYSALGPITRTGDRAYGAYQMMGNNIGPWSKEALGRSLSADEFLQNPSLQDQIFESKFGSYVNKYGPSGAAQAWFGGPGSVGKGGAGADILGTTGTAYVDKFNTALGDASKNVGTFGQGLGQIGQTLSTSFFPAAPAAPGGGGIGGLFGGLFSGGANLSKYVGLTGMFADGTNYAPGGLAIVGERGPELVNLPQGSQVHSNHKSRDMMRGGGGESGGIAGVRVFVDQDGNWQAKVDSIANDRSAQNDQASFSAFNEQQRRGGVGLMNRRYASQKN